MIGSLFSFRGRMGRLAYLGWLIVAGIVLAVGFAILLVLGVTAGLANGVGGAIVGSAVAVSIGLIPFVWMSLALSTKRLRDAGLPPLVIVPAVLAFSVFDMLVLSRQTGGPMVGGLPHNSPVGLGVNLAYGLVLLFWPSAEPRAADEEHGVARRPGEVAWHERALTLASTPAQTVVESYPAPSSRPLPGQPRTFGRRVA